MLNSKIKELGLGKQRKLLFEVLHAIHDKKIYSLARSMSSLPGMKVYDSFFDKLEKNEFNEKEIKEAFLMLGIIFDNVPGKRWYQFTKSDWDEKIINALKLIH